jgi:hypothetical protein
MKKLEAGSQVKDERTDLSPEMSEGMSSIASLLALNITV